MQQKFTTEVTIICKFTAKKNSKLNKSFQNTILDMQIMQQLVMKCWQKEMMH